jgi:hypothetical protein
LIMVCNFLHRLNFTHKTKATKSATNIASLFAPPHHPPPPPPRPANA